MTSRYQRQAEAEFDCVMLGQKRYEDARRESGESATPPGQRQTKLVLPVLTDAIVAFMERARKSGGRRHTAFPYLLYVEPEQAAYLTIRYVLDAAAVGRNFTTTAIDVATAIEDHYNVLSLDEEAPGLFHKVITQLKTSTSARHRTQVWRKVVEKYGKDRLTWTKTDKLALGAALIELMESSTTLVVTRNVQSGRGQTTKRIELTPEAREWMETAHVTSFAPLHLPMVAPPRDWTSPFRGGYLTGAIRGAIMIRSHSQAYLDEVRHVDMPEVYDAINIVQATPWRINVPVLRIMREVRKLGDRYQALFVEPDEPLPPRPAGVPEGTPLADLPVDQREAVIEWKRDASVIHEANNRRKTKREEVGRKLWVAERFVEEERIYFPHYLDFRGRMYPYASYLNPQSDDSGRALLEFADGKPLGERGLYWLKVHTANVFGVDKVSFDERVEWVESNLTKLLALAFSPLDNIDVMSEADSPWMALAACIELAGALIEGETYVSHLPIAMDGSCSGLQHYSAMLRDPVGGAAVNLVPAEKPGDIYSEVARRAQALVDGSADATSAAWKGGKVVRKIAKQPTMTLCYSATVYGMQGQIMKAIGSLGGDAYLNGGVTARAGAKYLAPVVWDAIGDTVLAARDAMAFLKELSSVAASEGLPIRWTSPAGFPVVQEYRESLAKRVEILYGGSIIKPTLHVDGSKLDARRQGSGVAPNFVHSLDAAHLMATVNLGATNELVDWAVVHDSFGVHAADVDTLHACVRETFVQQYTPNVLGRLRDEVAANLQKTHPELVEKLPALPPVGALDLDAVRQSEYFFA